MEALNQLLPSSFSGARSVLPSAFMGLAVVISPLSQAETEASKPEDKSNCPAVFQYDMKQLHSSNVLNLCDVSGGAPVLLVNTASHCGFTDQFGDLEKLHQTHKESGLVVVGVASDSFNQAADTEKEAADICFRNFGVTFTMLAPVSVKGDNAHPLFQQLGEQAGYPRWNFYKYLLNREGKVVESWSSFGMPDGGDIAKVL